MLLPGSQRCAWSRSVSEMGHPSSIFSSTSSQPTRQPFSDTQSAVRPPAERGRGKQRLRSLCRGAGANTDVRWEHLTVILLLCSPAWVLGHCSRQLLHRKANLGPPVCLWRLLDLKVLHAAHIMDLCSPSSAVHLPQEISFVRLLRCCGGEARLF